MSRIATTLVAAIAVLHLGIAGAEMFLWNTLGPKLLGDSVSPDLIEGTVKATRVMAANQGLYNGFLAAGLLWSLRINDAAWKVRIATCFLLFVLVAGLVGAVTASLNILWVQAVPALLALFFVRKI